MVTNSRVSSRRVAPRSRRALARRRGVRPYLLLALFLFVLGASCLVSHAIKGFAKEEHATYKYYTSIMVESGDTLWSIASEYHSEDVSIEDYMYEVQQLNGLTDGQLHQGAYITIPYYSAEVK